MILVDSHCHLDFREFRGDLAEVIERFHRVGGRSAVTICTRLSDFPQVLAIAERFESVWCSVGVHPHEAATEPDLDPERLARLAEHPKVVGIGECGLDFHYDQGPRDLQATVFRRHAAAARLAGLPLIVHSRSAEAETAEILREESAAGGLSGLMHCFSSGPYLAQKALEIGFYISFSGIVTFKKADDLREVARTLPLDRMLVETDAPYLAPVPHRGKRNEPAFVAETARALAELRGLAAEQFAEETSRNFFRLFRKVPPPPALQQRAA